jgi:hypothetical protein
MKNKTSSISNALPAPIFILIKQPIKLLLQTPLPTSKTHRLAPELPTLKYPSLFCSRKMYPLLPEKTNFTMWKIMQLIFSLKCQVA